MICKNFISARFFIAGMLYVFLVTFSAVAIDRLPVEADRQDWRILQNAQYLYDSGDYGNALYYADQARQVRKNHLETILTILNKALVPAEVRQAGDAIADVIPVLDQRQTTEAIKIIQDLVNRKSSDFFHGSVKQVLDYLRNSEVYPEADFLSGRIYQLEGEYTTAMKFYDSAWKSSAYLDVSDVKYDILYQMADLASIQKNNTDYEKYLLLIVADDPYYRNTALCSAIVRTISASDGSDSLEKFFRLYRVNNVKCLQAYFQLAAFYEKNGLNEKALTVSALGVLTAFTRMYEISKIRDADYTYSDFGSFLVKIQAWNDVLDWSREQKLWEGFVSFAHICELNKSKEFSRKLLTILSENIPDQYWRKKAASLLKSYQ